MSNISDLDYDTETGPHVAPSFMEAKAKKMQCEVGGIPIEIPPQVDKYDFIRIIGTGSFSVVALVVNRITHENFACKIVPRQMLVELQIFDRFEREVRIMQTMRHPSIVQLFDVLYDTNVIYLIMEYCSNGELFTMLTDNGRLDEHTARKMFGQIVDGLKYIHSRNVVHRDMKPENILLDESWNVKITDFGFCHQTLPNALLSTPCGSPCYAPPEVLSQRPYDGKKADVWSLGVVLYAMMTAALPWRQQNQAKLVEEIIAADYRIPQYVSKVVSGLIRGMLQADPDARFSIDDIAKHPWVADGRPQTSCRRLSEPIEALTARSMGRRGSAWQRQVIVRPKSRFRTEQAATVIRKIPAVGKKQTTSMLLPTLKDFR